MTNSVFATADSEDVARRIVEDLRSRGIMSENISALFPDKASSREFAEEQNTKMPEGASTGAAAGGVLGGSLGWLVGAGALAIPGLGPFIAAGPILAALSGAAAGAAVGGLTGALIGLGIPEHEVKHYENRIGEGGILISVQTNSREEAEEVKDLFKRDGAKDVSVV
ncbi:MAG: hypothetical protein K0R03_1358 [Moraxellaceae bacterium]|jgi:hypothetical protein|nr:hypothetical protein [Moraxellaceae bacterium]